MNLYAAILKDRLKQTNNSVKSEKEKISKEIERQNQRLKNARALMLDGEINPDDFKLSKIEIEQTIQKCSIELAQLNSGIDNCDKDIDACLELLKNLDKLYQTKDTAIKQRIIGSIFPSKLIFENRQYRTAEINSVIPLICKQAKAFRKSKNKKRPEIGALSLGVEASDKMSNQLLRDIQILANLRSWQLIVQFPVNW